MLEQQPIKDVDTLLDAVRGDYRFQCPEPIDGFIGFLSGYCLAARIDPSSFWSEAPKFVAAFLSASCREESMSRLIERHAGVRRSEVPIFYAALDWHRATVYANAWLLDCDAEWRADFTADEKRIHGDENVLQAPAQLALVEGSQGFWHIFYLNGAGERFYEASLRTEDKARRWASSCLRLGQREWLRTAGGSFNSKRDARSV